MLLSTRKMSIDSIIFHINQKNLLEVVTNNRNILNNDCLNCIQVDINPSIIKSYLISQHLFVIFYQQNNIATLHPSPHTVGCHEKTQCGKAWLTLRVKKKKTIVTLPKKKKKKNLKKDVEIVCANQQDGL